MLFRSHLELNLENKQYEYLSKVAMVLDRHVTLAPEATEIRVVLRDAASGSLGSVTVPTTALMAKDERNAAPTKPN